MPVFSREWRCGWSSTDRQFSNYIWVISNFIAYWSLTYITDLMVLYKSTIWFPGDGYGVDELLVVAQCLWLIRGWVGLWGFLWWAPSAKRKDHHGVSSGWSSVWHRSNTGLSCAQYEQIAIILGVWPFWLTRSLLFSVNNILVGLWLNCVSSVEITLFLLADILLQHMALFQCQGLVKSL